MDDSGNSSYHRPVWDDNGQFHYERREQLPLLMKEAQRVRKDAGEPLGLPPRRTHELISAGTAIRNTSPRIRGVLATDVDHGGAYSVDPEDRSRSVYLDLSDALMFTVRSVVKIVQQVPAP